MAEAIDAQGGKRKYKENPLTAKAETGSLKIKIMRKGEGALNGLLVPGMSIGLDGALLGGPPRSPAKGIAAQHIRSPPKPRPNRKHVPIFYQRPNAFDISGASSTDESVVQSTSTTSLDYEQTANASSTSTSSTTGRFARMDIATSNDGNPSTFLSDFMPMGNPLFSRGSSDPSGVLTDLLKHAFPLESQPTSSFEYSSGSSASTVDQLSASQSNLLNPVAALRQLASSSAAYSSQAREQVQSSHSSQLPSLQERKEEQGIDSPQEDATRGTPTYTFDPMSALQNAVKMAVATASPPSTHPAFGHLLSATDSDEGDLGPPPSAPPAFSVQHSLMGGGIESQPVISNVNTVNFDWNRHHQKNSSRSRSGSLPNVLAEEGSEDANQNGRSAVHRSKEV